MSNQEFLLPRQHFELCFLRHDPCVGVRATPIAEAMTALVVLDHFLRNRAQNADVVTEIPDYS